MNLTEVQLGVLVREESEKAFMPRVAIVHDFLLQMGGAEKVAEVLHEMSPEAPSDTSAFDRNAMPARYGDWDVRTSFLQRLPLKKLTHRAALLLYPTAFESFDFSRFDLVISSSWFAKGIVTQPHTTHICYTRTPMPKDERISMMARTFILKPLSALMRCNSMPRASAPKAGVWAWFACCRA